MAKVIKHNITYNSAPSTATLLPYNNTDSGLSATTTKGAIDELADEKADKTEVPDNLQDLDNVSISSATSGQVLKYNGSNWVNADESTGSSSFADLTDVDLSNLQNGQVAKYNSTTQKWENANESGGGSTVSVTQIQSTGTKIATISVDSVDTDLYAPNGGSGGHTIVDDAGTDLTQRTNLQFKGAYTEDNSTDDTTEVNVVREMTKAEFDLLSDDEKVGFINITDVTDGAEDKFQPIIYSGDEREIGVWTDGKPLYEITFTSTTNVGFNTDTLMVLDGTMPSGIEIIKTVGSIDLTLSNAHYSSSSSDWFSWYVNCNSNSIYASQSLASVTPVSCITSFTLIYTKTTDTAGSGQWTPQGIPAHHYSTDEQIVGTWIDGSTLYEKTVVSTNALILNTINQINLGITDVKDFVGVNGFASYGANNTYIPLPYGDKDNSLICLMNINRALGLANVWVGSDYTSPSTANLVIITIRYTKSSS